MNDGLLAGEDYGSSMKEQRVQVKVGQGASVYRGEAIVWGTADDITAGGNRSQGGALITPKQDFVIKVPVTRVNKLPVQSTAIMLTTPDGGIAGGNVRGIGAIDLQYYRTASDQVAGPSGVAIGSKNKVVGDITFGGTAIGVGNTSIGQGTTVVGYSNNSNGGAAFGASNTAIGVATLSLGNGNNITSQYSSGIGYANVSSSQYSISLGAGNTSNGTNAVSVGRSNTSSGTSGFATGYQATTSGVTGKRAHATGQYTSLGDNQYGRYITKVRTTNATATVLTTDGSAFGAQNQIVLPNYSVFSFFGYVTALRKGSEGAESKVFKVEGAVKRVANAASTAIIGSPTITTVGESPSLTWSIGCSADTTNGAIQIYGIGEAAKNIQWVSTIQTVESTYA